MKAWTAAEVGACIPRAQTGDVDALVGELRRDPEGVPPDVLDAAGALTSSSGRGRLALHLFRWQKALLDVEMATPQYALAIATELRAQAEATAAELITDYKVRTGVEPTPEFAYLAGQIGVLTATLMMVMQPDTWAEKLAQKAGT
jgi:hypothetical protein